MKEKLRTLATYNPDALDALLDLVLELPDAEARIMKALEGRLVQLENQKLAPEEEESAQRIAAEIIASLSPFSLVWR